MTMSKYVIIFLLLIIINIFLMLLELFIPSIICIFLFFIYSIFLLIIIIKKIKDKYKQRQTNIILFKNNIQTEKTINSYANKPEDNNFKNRFKEKNGYYIYDGDKINIKANLKEYKKFATTYYSKYPIEYRLSLENKLYINTNFRIELTFKELDNIESVDIRPTVKYQNYKSISISKNTIKLIFLLSAYEFEINKRLIVLSTNDINNINTADYPNNLYISQYDNQALKGFNKRMNKIIFEKDNL